jgi:hypothetical protein
MAQAAYYEDGAGRRAVVLFDDRLVREKTPRRVLDKRGLELVERVSAALREKGLIVLARDMFPSVGGLILPYGSKWEGDLPAPSAWIIDIEIPIGARSFTGVYDGIGLASHVRQADVRVRNRKGILVPIPILFLTHFAITDRLHDARCPETRASFLHRINHSVVSAWRFFHKDVAHTEPRVEEQFEDPLASRVVLTVDEFAEEVRKEAYA